MKEVHIDTVIGCDECRIVGVPYEARVDALGEGRVVRRETRENGVANVVARWIALGDGARGSACAWAFAACGRGGGERRADGRCSVRCAVWRVRVHVGECRDVESRKVNTRARL